MAEGGGAGLHSTPIELVREAPFRIGAMLVTPSSRQVAMGSQSEFLEPRVMQVLVALAQADGAVVSRDDLIERCWGGRIVGDNAIHRAVAKVRALGQTFASGAFRVDTITRIGYRMLIEPGEHVRLDAVAPVALPETAQRRTSPLSRRAVLMGGAAAAAGAGIGALWLTPRSDPMDARIATLIGEAEIAARMDLPDSNQRGIAALEEAVGLKPASALAWGRLALARRAAAEYAPPDAAADAVSGTQGAARRALDLDPQQADALSALALLPPYFGDWLEADRRMASVLDVSPDHLPTLDARDFMHVAAGRAKEGSQSRLRLAAREPLHAGVQFRTIYAHWILGQIGDADRTADRALQLWPTHPGVWMGRLWTLGLAGRPERGLAHVEDTAARPNLPVQMFELLRTVMSALASRNPGEVARASDRLIESVRSGPSNAVNAVMLLSALGEVDRAFDAAEAYLLERGPLIASVRWRKGDASVNDQRRRKTNMLFVPATAPMRGDPRFLKLADEVGLAAYWRQANVSPDLA